MRRYKIEKERSRKVRRNLYRDKNYDEIDCAVSVPQTKEKIGKKEKR